MADPLREVAAPAEPTHPMLGLLPAVPSLEIARVVQSHADSNTGTR